MAKKSSYAKTNGWQMKKAEKISYPKANRWQMKKAGKISKCKLPVDRGRIQLDSNFLSPATN